MDAWIMYLGLVTQEQMKELDKEIVFFDLKS